MATTEFSSWRRATLVHESEAKDGLLGRNLQVTLTELLNWAATRGIRLTSLRAATASLESVFLAVAGTADGHGAGRERTREGVLS